MLNMNNKSGTDADQSDKQTSQTPLWMSWMQVNADEHEHTQKKLPSIAQSKY